MKSRWKLTLLAGAALLCQPAFALTAQDELHVSNTRLTLERYLPKEQLRPAVLNAIDPTKNLDARGFANQAKAQSSCVLDGFEEALKPKQEKETEALLERTYNETVNDFARHLSAEDIKLFSRYLMMSKDQQKDFERTLEGANLFKKIRIMTARSNSFIEPELKTYTDNMLTYVKAELPNYINPDGSCKKGARK